MLLANMMTSNVSIMQQVLWAHGKHSQVKWDVLKCKQIPFQAMANGVHVMVILLSKLFMFGHKVKVMEPTL